MPPGFNLQAFARDSGSRRGVVLGPETVLELVPDVSWSSAHLDLVELNVIRHIDGVSPLALLETLTGISTDELQVMLAMLLARELVVVVRPTELRNRQNPNEAFSAEPTSGVFSRSKLGLDLDGYRPRLVETG